MPHVPQPDAKTIGGSHGGSLSRPLDQSTEAGTEWMVDAFDCQPTKLSDLATITALCDRVVDELGLNVLGSPLSHQFPEPGGVTALYMLRESHLACHTYPESRSATFNLYCCRRRPAWRWQSELSEVLGARRVVVRQVQRGAGSSAGNDRGTS